MVEQAVILAGGLGTRLGDLTKHTPKPLLNVAGRPFLTYLIWNLRRQGVHDLILAIGYHASVIQKELGDGSELGVQIRYSVEDTPLGTGGGVRNCLEFLADSFLVMNGDTLFDVAYQSLPSLLNVAENAPDGVLALRTVEDVSRYGSVTLDHNKITRFNEKGPSGVGLINGGVYLLRKSVVEAIPPNTKVSLETDVFPNLAKQGKVSGMQFNGYFLDIGLPETFTQAQTELPAWQQNLTTN